jgi:hypothetical protein
MLDVFPLVDHPPLVGPSRVHRALESLGARTGQTTVWQRVALSQQAPPPPPREPRVPPPAARPQATTAPHPAWGVALRSRVPLAAPGLYRGLMFAGESRALVAAGGCERPHVSRSLPGLRHALTPWSAPAAVGSAQGAVVGA